MECNFRDAKQYWGLEDFMNVTPTGVTNAARLILDSRVVMGQFWRNRLFLQAFHGGRDRGGISGKSL
jgi:hypothetical protein